MIRAVVFDIDDTFSLTEAVSFEIENKILAQLGRPAMSRKIHLETWELPPTKALSIRSSGVDVDKFKALYMSQIEQCRRSGTLDIISDANYVALDKLVEIGMVLFVLTARTTEQMQHMLSPSHQLASRVKTFYCNDNPRIRKPDPRVFDELLTQNSLQSNQCVYIGDAIRDAQAAKAAGLYFIASLESGLRQKKDFNTVPVDKFIDKFPDVVAAVKSLDERTRTDQKSQ